MISLMLVAALAGTPESGETKPLKVSIEFDKSADFSHIKTYTWESGIPMDDTLLESRLIEKVDGALRAKGWQKLDRKSADKPDATVVYSVSGKKKTDPSKLGRPSWSSGDFGHKSAMLSSGSLVLEINDAAKSKTVWNGVATGVLGQRAMSAEEAIDQAVEQLLRDFPPAPAN